MFVKNDLVEQNPDLMQMFTKNIDDVDRLSSELKLFEEYLLALNLKELMFPNAAADRLDVLRVKA